MFFASSLICGCVANRAQRRSPSIPNLFRFFDFICRNLENPDSHKYVDTNGTNIRIAISVTFGYESENRVQNFSIGFALNISLAPESFLILDNHLDNDPELFQLTR